MIYNASINLRTAINPAMKFDLETSTHSRSDLDQTYKFDTMVAGEICTVAFLLNNSTYKAGIYYDDYIVFVFIYLFLENSSVF